MDEKKCGQLQKLSGQGEQRYSELPVVCLGDTEDSQKRESYNDQDPKEQSQRQDYLWHLWTEDDGWSECDGVQSQLSVPDLTPGFSWSTGNRV